MAHKDVVVLEEEEDLGAFLQRLAIPFNELEQNFFDSIDDGFEGIKEIIEDSNLLLYDDSREFDDPSHNVSIDENHNVSIDENHNVSIDDSHNVSIDDSHNVSIDDSHNVSIDDCHNDFIDYSHNVSVDDSTDLKMFRNSSTASRGRSLAAKRRRNKGGRRKRRCFKSAASLFDSEVKVDKCCLHCGTRNTPLWREGPKGVRTLCNACGVRYKKGRLLPEYRPASSPGFKPNVHSNFHRKVMEIRREKNSAPNSFGFEELQP